MSTLTVSLEVLEILEHPNADALELAKVGEYRAVVPKSVYRTGDIALYIPEQSIIPPELIVELGLEGRLAGKEQNRVKAVRLRGELSQGIVCRPKWIWSNYSEDDIIDITEGDMSHTNNWAEELFITKWEPEIPASMSGQVEAANGLINWIEIENIKRFPDIFKPVQTGVDVIAEEIIASEKIHGTCCLITYFPERDELIVTSKGLGKKHLRIVESNSNVYWRAIRKYNVQDSLREIAAAYPFADVIGLFGEVFGKGVQDLSYGLEEQRFAVFDICIKKQNGAKMWIDQAQVAALMRNLEHPQYVVPILYQGAYNYNMLCELAEGPETVSGTEAHMREGLVVRSNIWDGRWDPEGDRPIAKFISEAYLLRGGSTTEFE